MDKLGRPPVDKVDGRQPYDLEPFKPSPIVPTNPAEDLLGQTLSVQLISAAQYHDGGLFPRRGIHLFFRYRPRPRQQPANVIYLVGEGPVNLHWRLMEGEYCFVKVVKVNETGAGIQVRDYRLPRELAKGVRGFKWLPAVDYFNLDVNGAFMITASLQFAL